MKIYDNSKDLIGDTTLIKIKSMSESTKVNNIGKLESLNHI